MEHLLVSPSTSQPTWRRHISAWQGQGTPSAGGEERRVHERVSIALPTKISGSGHTQSVSTHDVSLGGACISVDIPLEVGAMVEVDLSLPTQVAPARVRGEVRWSRQGRAGIIFRSGATAAVAAFVGSMLMSPEAVAAKTSVPTFDPNADVVIDMKAGGERPDEFHLITAFEQQYSSFDQCVADSKNNPDKTLPGDVDVEVLLNPKGHEPLGINATLPSTVDKGSLRECLRGAVAAADYPSYDGPPVVVSFSFQLDPGTEWEEAE